MIRILQRTRRLAADRRGATAMVFALMTPVLLGAGAYAVDMAHYRYVDNRLQSAVDSAALAGIRSLDDENIAVDEAVTFAQRNVPESYGTVTRESDVDIGIYDPATGSFTVAAGEDVNLSLIHI
jgi:Flp pilus assembly protein TadG